ncbi:MAG: ABC transporter permease [Ruminococcaceae bacterium]|nr:ABC transporter permease [Oscillospiraceae bacterium]
MGITHMKINNLGYLIKEGIRGIFLHGFASVAAVCVTVACLLIVGGFSCLMYNLNIMVEDLNKTNEVMVYVDETYTDSEARSVGTYINKVSNVFQATFVSREEALENFVEDYGGDSALVGVDANPLRHRFVVQLEDNSLIKETVAELEKVEGVVKVSAAYALAEGFTTLQDVLHIASIAVIGVLLVVSLLIISNTVKLAMYDRRDEIAIMKMVGATNGFIRLPYVVEGFTLGMIGAGLSFGLLWFLYNTLLGRLAEVDTLQMLNFVPFRELLVPMICVFAAAGLFVGVVGSWTSIRKFMDV